MSIRSGSLQTEDTLIQRAQTGALLLDTIEPDWEQEVDLDKLSMDVGWVAGDGCGCVLALLDGRSFNRGADARHIDRLARIALGFTLETPDFDFVSQWEILTAAWREAILSRRTKEDT